MSVGKNSIKRAAGKTAAPQDKEIGGAAPELANSCVAAAPKAAKPAAKAPAKPATKPAAKPAAKTAAKPAAAASAKPAEKSSARAALQTAPTGMCEKYAFGEDLPFYLL